MNGDAYDALRRRCGLSPIQKLILLDLALGSGIDASRGPGQGTRYCTVCLPALAALCETTVAQAKAIVDDLTARGLLRPYALGRDAPSDWDAFTIELGASS